MKSSLLLEDANNLIKNVRDVSFFILWLVSVI